MKATHFIVGGRPSCGLPAVSYTTTALLKCDCINCWTVLARSKNRAFRGAFRRGAKAFCAGLSNTENPYNDDKRKSWGGLTWSRAFCACWDDGWRFAESAKSTED